MHSDYLKLRPKYFGYPCDGNAVFDAELLGQLRSKLKCGKAPGLDGITNEHLRYCHPIVEVMLAKLFEGILQCGFVPPEFCQSYVVPLPKVTNLRSKSLTCNDFRGIAISSAISKVFENGILEIYGEYFASSDKQFGFKKGFGCTDAIYTSRRMVEHIITGGNTAYICALDISKAFDKTNHFGILLKLMKRKIPEKLLTVLEGWITSCWTCVKWSGYFSDFFALKVGVRQGSVLSPLFFAVYIDDIVPTFSLGRYSFVILYADDLLLISPSIRELQTLFSTVEFELRCLDMQINPLKSTCIKIGPRFNAECTCIRTLNGTEISWRESLRYLGVYMKSSHNIRYNLSVARRKFFISANTIFGKLGRSASEEVHLQLIYSKCIPMLIYGSECCYLLKSDLSSIDFVVSRYLMKLFRSNNKEFIKNCLDSFGYKLPSVIVEERSQKFRTKYFTKQNVLCSLWKD